jgi:hypothetical protein
MEGRLELVSTSKQEVSSAPGNDLLKMMKGGDEVTVVSGENDIRLATSDILLPGPFEPTDEMGVIQEERVEVTETVEGVQANEERVEVIETDNSIKDKSTAEDKLPPTLMPSLTGLQDEVRKKFEIVPIKMVAGSRPTYYHRCKNALVSSKTCLWLFCSMCTGNKQVEEKRGGEDKDVGCEHGQVDLEPCTNAETITRLTCAYIYASDDARNGYIPSRCVGCQKRIALDLDNEKADQHEISPIETGT